MRLIPGSGSTPSDSLFFGEAGGKSEHFAGRPFVGKAGQVLTTYMLAAGLPRPDVYIDNIFPYWTGEGNPDPTPEQVESCTPRTLATIRRVKPKLIGAVGRIATRWFLGDVKMEAVHGVPLPSIRPEITVPVIPIVHPAAGFYEPSKAAISQDDFFKFSLYLKNPPPKLAPPRISVVEAGYLDVAGGACDTEGSVSHPEGISWSASGQEAQVLWGKKEGGGHPRLQGLIEFHYGLHDLPVLRALGVDVSQLQIGDTMVRAFVLQTEPQSLKALAFRYLGLRMQEWEEVVRPHYEKVAVAWLEKAVLLEYKKPTPRMVEDLAKRKWRKYKPQATDRRLKNVLTAHEKNATQPEDKQKALEKRWEDLDEWVKAEAETKMRESFPRFCLDHVPRKKAIAYSGTDAAATALLAPILDAELERRGLRAVYEMDRRSLRFIDRCQETGMRLNVEKLKVVEAELEDTMTRRLRTLRCMTGDKWFNAGSRDQVGRWLYKLKGLPVYTYTDTGLGSTKDVALQLLRGHHGKDDPEVEEFCRAVQDYREAQKLKGSFVEPIFNYMVQDRNGSWRIHTTFKTTRVVSGRLATENPNVLAIPSRTEMGKRIRDCFEAEEGWLLVDVDESQIELRTVAHFSHDPRMQYAFEHDEDLHILTASIIFRKKLSEVGKGSPERYIAKTINFAIVYGISPKALLDQLYVANIFDYTLQDCERIIAEWFKVYAAVKEFLKRNVAQAMKRGYAQTMFGRICYVPNLKVMDKQLREAAERLTNNFPVQGTASDLVKRAEISFDDWIRQSGLDEEVKPWLQMHDELLVEVRKPLAKTVMREVQRCMTQDQELFRVPIVADGGIGRSWAEAKE